MSQYQVGLMPLRMVQRPPFSIEAPGASPVEGETIPRRHPKAKNGLITRPDPEIGTLYDLLKHSAKKYADEPAVGTRKLVKTHKEVKKVPKVVDGETIQVDKEWTYFELSEYSYLTYSEYDALITKLGSGLRKLGLETGDKLHIFASTSANWLAMAHACSSQSLVIATAYDTLGESGVEHSLVQTKAKAMFLDPHLLKTASSPLDKANDVKYLIYNDESNQPIPDSQIQAFKDAHPHLIIKSISELRELGEENPYDPVPPSPKDLFCIMYTSGSTGPPKGVPLEHESLVAAVASLHAVVGESVSRRDYLLAYLPLAHIFELAVENLVLFIGATLGYGNSRTLSDSSMRNSAGDMREFAPTIMVGVPQIWETVKKGVVAKVDSSGWLTKNLFWGAFNLKSLLVQYGLPGQEIFDGIVFGKVRTMTGGRLRFIVNGASGISEGTQRFMSMVVAPMISGYGLTETCGNGALGSPLQWTTNAVGPMPAGVEIKLVSLPELNYSTDTTPPQGEMLIRGLPVMKKYYENPEETEKAVTKDGWFKTGDIGEFDSNGHIKVIDRVKNLVKMQGGEYIALEKVEAVYKGSHLVQSIMVYGDSEHPRAIAIISPSEKALADLAKSLGVEESRMYSDKQVREATLKDVLAVGKKGGLGGLEMISGVALVEDEWTPVNGLVTATQKVNRRALKEKYEKKIQETFKGN